MFSPLTTHNIQLKVENPLNDHQHKKQKKNENKIITNTRALHSHRKKKRYLQLQLYTKRARNNSFVLSVNVLRGCVAWKITYKVWRLNK